MPSEGSLLSHGQPPKVKQGSTAGYVLEKNFVDKIDDGEVKPMLLGQAMGCRGRSYSFGDMGHGGRYFGQRSALGQLEANVMISAE